MTEQEQLRQAIAHLESQRALLGDAVVDAALERGRSIDLNIAGRELLVQKK